MTALVLGLGNVLMGDDAFGPSVIAALQAEYAFPPAVDVMDGGTPGLNLAPVLMDRGAVIVVDTVKGEGRPGELRYYRKPDLLRRPPAPRYGPHEPALADLLAGLDLAGCGPEEVYLVGAIPGEISGGIRLSEPLRQAIPGAVRAVVEELGRLGLRLEARARPACAAAWWEG
jgi:hydrogenase maturation protease